MNRRGERVMTCAGLILCAASLGCQGELVGGSAASTEPNAGAPGSDADGAGPGVIPADAGSSEPEQCGASIGARAPLRRLSRDEYLNALSSIMPAETIEDARLSIATLSSDDPEYKNSPGSFDPGLDAVRLDGVFSVGRRIAAHLTADPSRLASVGPACLGDDPIGASCARELAADLGARLFRRPLTGAELEAHAAAWDAPGALETSERLEALALGLLLDPSFLFITPDAASADALSPGALAERIAWAAWGAPPDQELRAAAEAGELADRGARREHARRLLESEPGRRHVRQLFRRWLALEREVDLNPSAPNLDLEVDGFYEEMVAETLDFVEHVVFEERGGLHELMTAPWEFPRSDRLARLFGHADSSDGAVRSSSGREGLLGRPALLAHVYDRPAPIHRAAHVMFRVLCRVSAPPSDANDVANMRLESIGDPTELSARALAEVVTAGPQCMACHTQINPLGFALTGYGPLGEAWDVERVYDRATTDGTLLGEIEVDDEVELWLDGQQSVVRGSGGLGAAIAASEEGRACAATQIYRLTHLRDAEGAEACHVRALKEAIDAGEPLIEILARNAADESAAVLPSTEGSL